MQWSAIVAAVGFARRHLNRDFAARRYLTDAVFPVYILHQTLIIVLAVSLARWQLPVGVEAPLLVLGTFALSLLGFEVVRRVPMLRPWFGLPPASRRSRHAAPTPATVGGSSR
jgi:surface polysaccharide O-acyltransferase-like enzyme